MKRIFTIILMVQSLLLAPIAHAQTYWDGTADKEFSGMGTEADPYLITTAEELAGLAARVNDTVNREDFAGKYSAYNKCQIVYQFLASVIAETNKRIRFGFLFRVIKQKNTSQIT